MLRPLAVLATALLLLSAACDDEDGTRASAIACHSAYRASTSEPLLDTVTMLFPDEASSNSVPYDRLELHARYGDGRLDGERALRLWVTPAGEATELFSQLYQFEHDAGPMNQFIGGHGFTGLTYAHDPASGAELQYWCEAE